MCSLPSRPTEPVPGVASDVLFPDRVTGLAPVGLAPVLAPGFVVAAAFAAGRADLLEGFLSLVILSVYGLPPDRARDVSAVRQPLSRASAVLAAT